MTTKEDLKLYLKMCIEELETIRKQWRHKGLDDFFFILPYELNELISNVKEGLK